MRMETHYGKAEVSTYRSWASPLRGVRQIPESPWTGTDNELMAAEIDVKVLGTAFDAAYTEGDNSMVVATDTMKNFTHRESLAFTGSTLEGWLFFLGQRFLDTYPQMEKLVVSGKELRFDPAVVPDGEGGFRASTVLFEHHPGDHGVAQLHVERGPGGTVICTDLTAGRQGLELVKLTGSAFAAFARDGYTTLPERRDRTLYSHIDIGWRYADPTIAITPDAARYVGSPQVADLAGAVFEEFVSLSIQHLVHEIGQRMFERYPEIVEVSFEAQNRTWDLGNGSPESEPGSVPKVFTDPRPPYGRIGLVLHRD
ncbi:MAG: urate oxidase [Chloroflexota bacterium]